MLVPSADKLKIDFRFRANELAGIGSKANRWQVLRAFLTMAEGRVERLIEGKNGFVMLISIPDQQSSGAVYIYHEPSRSFYWLEFGDRSEDLSGYEFDKIASQLERFSTAEAIERTQERKLSRFHSRNLARFTRRRSRPALISIQPADQPADTTIPLVPTAASIITAATQITMA